MINETLLVGFSLLFLYSEGCQGDLEVYYLKVLFVCNGQIISEYDQEIPQSQSADQLMTP